MSSPRGPDTQRTGWPRNRVVACAVGSVLAPVLLFTAFYVTDVSRVPVAEPGPPPGPSAAEVPPPAPSASVPVAASAEPAPSTSAAPEAPDAGDTVDGLDGPAWRRTLRQTAVTSDWKRGASAIVALSQIDPSALEQPDLTKSASTIVMGIELSNTDEAARVYEALGKSAGGVDVLYDIASRRGGSKAAVRATELLAKPEVRARVSPALEITLQMREAPCAAKEALLERAVAEGDHRTLVALIALRSPDCNPSVEGCCLRENEKMELAVRRLSARLRPTARAPADPY